MDTKKRLASGFAFTMLALGAVVAVLMIAQVEMPTFAASAATPTPQVPGEEEYFVFFPLIAQHYDIPGDFRWRLLVGSWEGYQGGPEEQEAHDWGGTFFGSRGMAWRVGCFPPEPIPDPWPTDLCNWRVIAGRWPSEFVATRWAEENIGDAQPWEPVLYYSP